MDEYVNVGEDIQYIVIKMGGEQFGIDIQYVDNIVRIQSITRVPKVADYIKGVINLRGEIIPVMNLRIKMNLEEEEYTKASRIIILKFDQHESIGFIVDEVKEVVTLNEFDVEKVEADRDEKLNFVSGVGKVTDGLVSVLDLHAVIEDY
ncbi:MAG: chemotaxis protein CheW [Eubacteriales bacterium]